MEKVKKCYNCSETKLLIKFHKNKSRKDGHKAECKECANEYMKKYYYLNDERIKEYGKKYREQNKEKIYEKDKQKFNCECGGKYTHGHKQNHFRTKKHLDYINKLN